MIRKLLLPVVAGLTAVVATSCSNIPGGGGGGLSAYNSYDRPAKLPSNRSAVRVKVSLRNQMAYVLEGATPLLVMPVAIGTASTPTPQGSFRIFDKNNRHRAASHGFGYNGSQAGRMFLANKPGGWSFKGTPMPFWCEFKPDYGFHTGWLKPYPCTHGCIRMHHNVAPKFYQLVSVGTPVSIAATQPEDETIGRNVPRPPDSGPLPDFPPSYYIGDGYFSYYKAPKFE